MTKLGQYLENRSVKKSEVSRRTGISKARVSSLCIDEGTKLRADELYLMALAINSDPCEVLRAVVGHLKLKS